MTPSVHRVTPYEPAARTDAAHPYGRPFPYASRGQFAAAYTAAVAMLALDAGVDHLTIDNPMAYGFHSFGTGPSSAGVGGHGLSGLFPYDLAGYHDGARVPLATALGLVRAMVLHEGTWCRLVGDGGFFVHVGYASDVYVGGRPLADTAERIRRLGLSIDPVDASPFDPAGDEVADDRPADASFWADVAALVADRGSVLLEEQPIGNAYHWHRLTTPAEIDAARTGSTPRSRLAVWPDLTDDGETLRAVLRQTDHPSLLVQGYDGGFHQERIVAPGTDGSETSVRLIHQGPGRRSALVPLLPRDRRPLLSGVLPDPDGVPRARWRTNPTRADQARACLSTLRVGTIVTGVVATGMHDIGVYVSLDEASLVVGLLRSPEMSWTRFESVDDIAPIGRRIRARITDVDWNLVQVSLSVRELLPDPLLLYCDTHRVGDTVPGTVTKSVPFGVFVRIADGVEGLIRYGDPAEHPDHRPEVPLDIGEHVLVTVTDFDRERRRIALTPAGPAAPRRPT